MVNVLGFGIIAFVLVVGTYIGMMRISDRTRENAERLERLEKRVDDLVAAVDDDEE